jgi:hypothetical protein
MSRFGQSTRQALTDALKRLGSAEEYEYTMWLFTYTTNQLIHIYLSCLVRILVADGEVALPPYPEQVLRRLEEQETETRISGLCII